MARAAAAPPRRPPPSAVAAAAAAASSPTPPTRVPHHRRGATLVRSLPLPRPPKGSGGGGGGIVAAPPRRRARAPASCACSPTTHPGSFRCALHRGHAAVSPAPAPHPPASSGLMSAPRRASMANPLVRVAAAEGGGDQTRRSALASLVGTPRHRRRARAFRPRPSRLSAVSSAADEEEE